MSATILPCNSLAERIETLAIDVAGEVGPSTPAQEQWLASIDLALSLASSMAQESGLRGVPELLRVLQAGLAENGSSGHMLSEEERQFFSLWLIQLAAHCAGALAPEERPVLVDSLAQVPWVPQIAPRMRDFILLRLAECAMASPAVETTDATLEATAIESTDASLESIAVELADVTSEPAAIEPLDAPLESIAAESAHAAFEPIAIEPADEPFEPIAIERVDESFEPFAFEPSDVMLDAHEPPAPVESQGEPDAEPVAISDDTIWIAAEELALARSAISNMLIPLTQELFAAEHPQDELRLFNDLEFHTGLIANAFEVLGLDRLRQLTEQVQALLRPETPGLRLPTPDALIAWQAALLAFMEQADTRTVDLLCQVTGELLGGDIDRASLEAELSRIRIGIDPRLVAARKREATPDDVVLELAPDVLPSVLEGMLRELPGNAQRLGESVRTLLAGSGAGGEELADARRFAHTLKGDANAVGLRGLANITHVFEDILLELAQGAEPPSGVLADVITDAADAVEAIADHVLQRGPPPEDLLSLYQRLLDAANALFLAKAGGAIEPAAVELTAAPDAPLRAIPAEAVAAPTRAVEASQQVAVSLLNEVLRLAGETIVLVRQIEQRYKSVSEAHRELAGQNRGNRDLVSQLDDLVALRGAALKSTRLADTREVDPLELDQYNELHVVSRRLIESNSDQSAFMQRMDRDLLALDDLLSMQERTQGELQRLALRTRSVPLSNVVGRLQRVVRQVSRQLLKPAELEIKGASTEIDSELLDRIVEPLSHILRNAIDHGIEPPEERAQLGKPETGRIELSVATYGDVVEIAVADDGRGLDTEAVRRRAIEMGVLGQDDDPGDDEIARLVMLPGFSTKRETTQVSGRGIGMDVVAQRVSDMRGAVSLSSTPGKGMQVRLRLPASLTSANVVLAHDGQDAIAAVATSISRILALEPRDFEAGPDGRLYVHVDEEPLPAIPLAALFDASMAAWRLPDTRRTGLVLDVVGAEPHVVYVERVDEVRNVIVKNLGSLKAVPALRGITVLGDGGIAPVLDLAQSIQEVARGGAGRYAESAVPLAAVLPRIVIADDSLSVRRALEQLMQDAGYSVVAARDGIEAIDAIRDSSPAAVLLDLEMPRLNGLDVTRFLRHQPETEHLPVIMITSRASDKYQSMAREAGVDHMLGKPFDEDELVLLVRQCVAAAAASQAAPPSSAAA